MEQIVLDFEKKPMTIKYMYLVSEWRNMWQILR